MTWFTTLRRMARRAVPGRLRLQIRLCRRLLLDRIRGTRFPSERGDPAAYMYRICRYERRLICYPGQEAAFSAKRRNIEIALARVDRTVVKPGVTFSFWRTVGRPDAREGYAPAAALKDGSLIEEVGGAVCLVSTVFYNVALLAAMAIEERRCHSVDSYGDGRYFEPGRDASVEYAYIDLRARNRLAVPIILRAHLDGDTAVGEAWSCSPANVEVIVAVDPPELITAPVIARLDPSLAPGVVTVDDPGAPGMRAVMRRIVTIAGVRHADAPVTTFHEPRPRYERRGPP